MNIFSKTIIKILKLLIFSLLLKAPLVFANNIENLCNELKQCLSQVSPKTKDLILEGTDILQKLNQLNKKNNKTRKEIKNTTKEISKLKTEVENICNNIESEAVLSILIDLSPTLKVLDKDKTMYHWYGEEEVGLIDSLKHAYGWQNLFFEPIKSIKDDGNWMGKGLYAASDPFHTMDYGANLLKIDIPKGTHYLDVDNYSYNLSQNTIDQLKKEGCELSVSKNDNDIYKVEKKFFTSRPECIPFFERAFKKLNIGFVSYEYGGMDTFSEFCPNGRDYNAIVTVNLNLSPVYVKSQTKWDFIQSQEFKDYLNISRTLNFDKLKLDSDKKTFVNDLGFKIFNEEDIAKVDKQKREAYTQQNKDTMNQAFRYFSYHNFYAEDYNKKEETMDTIPTSRLNSMRDKMFGCN